jgi:hypothetical protein
MWPQLVTGSSISTVSWINEELTRERIVANCEISCLPKSSRCNGRRKVRIWCCKCVLRCSMSAWRRPFVTGIRTSGQNGLSTHFFMLSTLAQSTLGGLFGLFLLVVAKATYLTFPHVPTHSAAGSSASHWSLGFPRPPDPRHHRRFS